MEAIAAMLLGVVVVVIALIFVRKQSTSARWGTCPRCGARLPEKAEAGGWTCEKCGCKVGEYGRERTGE
jgi:ribosomal protein L37AE/L43A